jgi:hypothetical protein
MGNTRLFLVQFNWTVLCALSLFVFATAGRAQESVDLKIHFAHGKQVRIACDFSHSGSVIVDNDEQDKVTSLPLHVDAKLTFFQRSTGDEQTIRFFETAGGKIKLENGTTSPSLDAAKRLIVARLRTNPGALVEMASMDGILEQAELELIQNPADPMTLADVFNKTDVEEGDRWKPSKTALAKMLRVHEIEKSSVQLLLKKVEAQSARVYIMGSLDAKVDDVITQMEISGIAIIDLNSNMLSNFKLGIREVREPGQIAPGFEGRTKIDVRMTDASTPQLSSAALAKHTENKKIRQRVKWQSQTGNFTVKFEPRWKMIAAEEAAAILRFIDRNDLLTQCNIVQLPSRPADNPLTLNAYKTEVAKILEADENAVLVSAASTVTTSGDTALRVVVAGEEEGLPVSWFYYHVSSQDGRQVTLVFTMAKSVAKRVTTIATQLVNEFEFQPMPKKVASAKSDESNAQTPFSTMQKR